MIHGDAGVLIPSANERAVLYLTNSAPSHAARLKGRDRFVSKWGLGLLWEHGLYELPVSYGERHKLFALTGEHEAIKVFLEYAKKF